VVDLGERVLHGVVLIRGDERLDPRVVLVADLDGDEISIGIVGERLLSDAVLLRIEAGLQRPVGVDDGGGKVVDRAADDAGVEFLDLEVFRVIDDVGGGGENAGRALDRLTAMGEAAPR
jgi:hypothetical protein